MADFAGFAEAVGRTLGWPAETALSDYNDNRREATMTQLEDSPLADILLGLGADLNDWSGTSSALYAQLTTLAGKNADSARWPTSPARLTIELRRIAPQLGTYGIIVHSTRRNFGRIWSLARDRSVAETSVGMRNPMADNQLGLEVDTPEKCRPAQA